MVGRWWELCANQCPAERPCDTIASEQCRAEWDRRNAATAAGKDPYPWLPRRRLNLPGLGDAVYHLAHWTGMAWLFGKNHCSRCNARRRWLNELPGRLLRRRQS
jgi:hypothetical protein